MAWLENHGPGKQKIGDKEIWKGRWWMEILDWTKIVKIFISHVNAHQRTEEDPNDQNKIPYLWMSVSLHFPIAFAQCRWNCR